MRITLDEIDRRFDLHGPTSEAHAEKMDNVRYAMKAHAQFLVSELPPCRETSLALTKLEECCYFALGALVRPAVEKRDG